jgi:phage terminase large subunit-like protein
VTDNRDNIMFAKPDRVKEMSRIDGLAAIVNAMRAAIAAENTAVSVRSIG